METYNLLCADNIELRNATVKATYTDRKQAIQALHQEIGLACAQHNITAPIYCRFLEFKDKIAVDFGSWSDFIGLTGVSMADLDEPSEN